MFLFFKFIECSPYKTPLKRYKPYKILSQGRKLFDVIKLAQSTGFEINKSNKFRTKREKKKRELPLKSAVQAPFIGTVLSPHKQLIFDESLGSGTQLVPWIPAQPI